MSRLAEAFGLNFSETNSGRMKKPGQVNFIDPLSEEARFRGWIKSTPWYSEFLKEYKEQPDISSGADYNYREAWKAGISPQRDPYDNNRYHWPSSKTDGEMLKSANHPTAWKEHYMRQTGKNPDAVGATVADYEKLNIGFK